MKMLITLLVLGIQFTCFLRKTTLQPVLNNLLNYALHCEKSCNFCFSTKVWLLNFENKIIYQFYTKSGQFIQKWLFFQIKFVLSKNLRKYECYEQKCDLCVFNGGQYILIITQFTALLEWWEQFNGICICKKGALPQWFILQGRWPRALANFSDF